MSHTFVSSDGTVIHHNPDLSEVFINVDNSQIDDLDGKTSHVTISGDALLEFIAEYMRREAIAKMEDFSVKDIVEYMIK